MKVLVTGASGHLGYHICKLLRAGKKNEYQTRGMVRKTSYTAHLERLGLEIATGDVLNYDSFERVLDGIEAVIHTAAIYRMTETDRAGTEDDAIINTAVDGTKNLFRAAGKQGVQKIVFTSSVAAVGSTRDKTLPLTEKAFANHGLNAYYTAKIESEKLALRLGHERGIHTTICNPATIVGKDDYKLTPSNRMLLDMVRKSRFYVDGGQNLADAEDVARGHLLALKKGKDGTRYILCGDNIEFKTLTLLIRDILNVKGPLIKLNETLLYGAGFTFDMLSKLTGRQPLLSRAKVSRAVGKYTFYDASKARQDLGYTCRPLGETLPETLKWLLYKWG